MERGGRRPSAFLLSVTSATETQPAAREPAPAARSGGGSPNLGEAILRNIGWFLLPIVLLLGLAVLYSVKREATYTATARMTTTRIDVTNVGALPGLVQASQDLAGVYSRAIGSRQVLEPVAAKVGRPVADVQESLTASPVPKSGIVVVDATGSDEQSAVGLANAAVESLVTYVRTLQAPRDATQKLERQIRSASLKLSRIERRVRAQRRRVDRQRTRASREQLDESQVDAQLASLRLDGLRTRYQALEQIQSGVTPAQVFRVASSADSDRSRKAQVAVLLALVIGSVLGAALAGLRARRRTRAANA